MPKIARLDETFAADLKRRFDDYRAAFPYRKRHQYPVELQQVLLDAYRGGVPARTLASTAGVSISILKFWIFKMTPEEPFVPEGGALEAEPAAVVCALPAADVAQMIESLKAKAAEPMEATVRKLSVKQGMSGGASITFPSGLKLKFPGEVCLDPTFIMAIAALRFPE